LHHEKPPFSNPKRAKVELRGCLKRHLSRNALPINPIPYSTTLTKNMGFSDSLLLTRAFKTKVWELSVIYSHA
jgi:hypothetical protein